MRRWLVVAVVLLALVGVWWSHPGRSAMKTALFVLQILPQAPVHPQEWLAPEPRVQEVLFPTSSGAGLADLYEPSQGGKKGAVVLFLGVNPAGRDDPRVVNLGKALARAGIVTLIPWSEPMTQKRVEPGEVDTLVDAFRYLVGLPSVDARRAGMGGFCVGASFALMAAADPRIREQVAFVNALSVYFDARDLVVQIASRTRFWGDRVEAWDPDPLTREVFEGHLVSSLSPEEQEGVRRALAGEQAARDALSPQARAVLGLLGSPSLEEARAYLRQLPPQALAFLERISPSQYVGNLRATVLIMQDREDALVPSPEARRLAQAVQGRVPVRYTEFSLFRHVDPARRVGLVRFAWEVWKLFRHLYAIISLAG
ncbi:MAG: alpha/beta hydrolase family protein [Dehalococcoidia bacterium]